MHSKFVRQIQFIFWRIHSRTLAFYIFPDLLPSVLELFFNFQKLDFKSFSFFLKKIENNQYFSPLGTRGLGRQLASSCYTTNPFRSFVGGTHPIGAPNPPLVAGCLMEKYLWWDFWTCTRDTF